MGMFGRITVSTILAASFAASSAQATEVNFITDFGFNGRHAAADRGRSQKKSFGFASSGQGALM